MNSIEEARRSKKVVPFVDPDLSKVKKGEEDIAQIGFELLRAGLKKYGIPASASDFMVARIDPNEFVLMNSGYVAGRDVYVFKHRQNGKDIWIDADSGEVIIPGVEDSKGFSSVSPIREMRDELLGEAAHWHWVEDDDEKIVFVGNKAQALSFYKKRGGTKSGLHLISATKGQGGSPPEVGKKFESMEEIEDVGINEASEDQKQREDKIIKLVGDKLAKDPQLKKFRSEQVFIGEKSDMSYAQARVTRANMWGKILSDIAESWVDSGKPVSGREVDKILKRNKINEVAFPEEIDQWIAAAKRAAEIIKDSVKNEDVEMNEGWKDTSFDMDQEGGSFIAKIDIKGNQVLRKINRKKVDEILKKYPKGAKDSKEYSARIKEGCPYSIWFVPVAYAKEQMQHITKLFNPIYDVGLGSSKPSFKGEDVSIVYPIREMADELLGRLDLGEGSTKNKIKISKDIFYFPSFRDAMSYAKEHGFPTDRIIEYEKGWAIQLRISGPYVGPNSTRDKHEEKDVRLDEESDLETAQVILLQMGGGNKIRAMIGAKKFIGIKNGVYFSFPNKKRSAPNAVRIELDRGRDTYDVTFLRADMSAPLKTLKKYNDIYADSLKELFEKETGLYLSF